MDEILDISLRIEEWIIKQSSPNQSHKYSRCIICNLPWWDNDERHNFDCFVPNLKRVIRNQQIETTGE